MMNILKGRAHGGPSVEGVSGEVPLNNSDGTLAFIRTGNFFSDVCVRAGGWRSPYGRSECHRSMMRQFAADDGRFVRTSGALLFRPVGCS
jgi:hypothetical protein